MKAQKVVLLQNQRSLLEFAGRASRLEDGATTKSPRQGNATRRMRARSFADIVPRRQNFASGPGIHYADMSGSSAHSVSCGDKHVCFWLNSSYSSHVKRKRDAARAGLLAKTLEAEKFVCLPHEGVGH